jgi:transposase-like protein
VEAVLHRQKRPVWRSWRRDETDSRLKGEWRALARALGQCGQTLEYLLTSQRDEPAARRFLTQARRRPGVPEQIIMAGSAANAAAPPRATEAYGTTLLVRQVPSVQMLVD